MLWLFFKYRYSWIIWIARIKFWKLPKPRSGLVINPSLNYSLIFRLALNIFFRKPQTRKVSNAESLTPAQYFKYVIDIKSLKFKAKLIQLFLIFSWFWHIFHPVNRLKSCLCWKFYENGGNFEMVFGTESTIKCFCKQSIKKE